MYLIESLRTEKRLVKTIGNLSQNENDFAVILVILYENSKIPFFDLKFLVSGPTFHERTCNLQKFLSVM